ATYGHIQNGRRKGLVVEAHAHQIAHCRGREICRGLVEWHANAELGIAANGRPTHKVIEHQRQECGRKQERITIVVEEPYNHLPLRGWREESLGPGNQYGET